jgi:hypothetical protein
VTVLDQIADSSFDDGGSLPQLRWPRGTDQEELDRVEPMIAHWRDDLARPSFRPHDCSPTRRTATTATPL